MKIIYYWSEKSGNMFQWQRYHFFDELKRIGHEIEVFNPLKFESKEHANEELLFFLTRNIKELDIFMTCEGSDVLFSETIREIRKFDLPTLLICFDNLHAPHMHKRIAPLFDLVWLTSRETIYLFKKWGCHNLIFLPYASNPFLFKPNWNHVDRVVSFIGTAYGTRIQKLNRLTLASVNCKVFSNEFFESDNHIIEASDFNTLKYIETVFNSLCFDVGRKMIFGALKNKYFSFNTPVLQKNFYLKLEPSVSFEEMQSIYSNSSLSLNISELRNTYALKNPVHKIHLRTFEIPMCGGLEIVSYTEELASYYEEDKEIIFYRDSSEFVSKAKFYLDRKNDNLCRELKVNARLRSEADHTWKNRFGIVFQRLNV